MMKLIGIFLILPIVAFAGSPRELVIPITIPRAKILPRILLNQQEVLEDIEILIETIQRGYGGWKTFKGTLEGEIFPQLRQLKGRSTEALCQEIGLLLDKIKDNHLSVRFAGSSKKCSGAPERQGRVGANIQTDKTLPWGYFEREAGSRKVAVVSIVRGALDTSEGWKGFLERAREIYAGATALIIDLRGNDGGDDTKLEQFARIFYGMDGTNVQLEPTGRVIRRQTPESYALFANTFGLALLKDHWDKKPKRKDVAGYRKDFLNLFELSLKEHLNEEGVTETDDPAIDLKRAFKGPIRLLADGLCASACEGGLEFFDRLPLAKRVGENTAGTLQFGNVGTVILKNSHLIVNLPTQRFEFTDGRLVEKIGYSPHLRVEPGKDALEAALKDLN
jgi:hypothetical protein